MSASLTIELDHQLKDRAEQNARQLGLDLSTIMQMVVQHLAVKSTLPEGLIEPNEETLCAIAELEQGINISRYANVNALKQDLGW